MENGLIECPIGETDEFKEDYAKRSNIKCSL
jgi:hypothetical protein